jgi:predicted negative regulator of RcsB-dependent stress response
MFAYVRRQLDALRGWVSRHRTGLIVATVVGGAAVYAYRVWRRYVVVRVRRRRRRCSGVSELLELC